MTAVDGLYQEVVCVTYRYLGPAADRFVTRMVQSHLAKKPGQLQPKDIDGLAAWLCLAMGVISDDEAVVKQFEAELAALNVSRFGRRTA